VSSATKKKILVVEDEPDIRELLRYNLEGSGFSVIEAGDGASALALAKREKPALIVLDLMLPEGDGLDVCRLLRADPVTAATPIVMVTAKAAEVDRVLGLELGADDYVTKPFSPRELALRVGALLRRSHATDDPRAILDHGPLRLDPSRHRCWVDGEEISLTAKEFDLLQGLMTRPGRVLSREALLEQVWGSDITVTVRTIDTHLKRLREKLGAAGELIETVRGVGYRFAE
jgi:two-component system phosphate regulon response regulator PhoB